MQPPPERKTRILVAAVGAVFALAMVGSFFWPVLRDYLQATPGKANRGNLPFLLFGLVFVGAIIFSFVRQLRAPAQPSLAAAKPPASGKAGGIFLFLFATPFAAFGVFALVQAFQKWNANNLKDAAGLGVFGLIFCGVGFGLMAAAIFGAKKSKQVAAIQAQHPDAPWQWRPDWAAGEIKSSDNNSFVVLWFMALVFCAVGGFIVAGVLPQELAKGNHAALLALLFPVAGLGLLCAAIYQTLRRKKFGAVAFKMSSVPGVIGGALAGAIRIPAHFQPQAGVHLQLRCVRRVTTGSGKNQHTSEEILWADEKVLGDNLPRTGTDEFDVPVFFKIPGDARQTDGSQPRDQIVWHLTATSRQPGIDFRADFDVPVFRTAQSGAADFLVADATAKYQMPVEELRRDEHSKIQVNDSPNGREFYFPAARNIGVALSTTLLMLIFNGIAAVMFHIHAPILFTIVVGLLGVLFLWGTFYAWFASTRVMIDSTGVRATNSYLFFTRTRRFEVGDIARFAIKPGMQSGSKIFYNIKLIKRGSDDSFETHKEQFQESQQINQLVAARLRATAGSSGVTVAGDIASTAEAKWLVQEMTKALGRRA